jgi:hypothetical protein
MVAMRLDHMLLAVRDLDYATFDFRHRLGMNVVVGGVHPGRGTHNSLVHFGSAYLELIAVHDSTLPRAQDFVSFLSDGDAPFTFALAVDDLDAAGKLLKERGLGLAEPIDGSRKTPEGVLLKWRSAQILPGKGGPGPESPPLPFIIQWENDQAGMGWFRDRVTLGRHAVQWGAVHSLIVATRDPTALAREYSRLFGWEVAGAGDPINLAMPGGNGVNLSLGAAPFVTLVSGLPHAESDPAGVLVSRAAARRIEKHGAGVIGLAIQTTDMTGAIATLVARGAHVRRSPSGRWAAVEPNDAHGMLIQLVEK